MNRTLDQKEERIKSLKSRLEDAVRQNNKLKHNLELKDDKIQGLERRYFCILRTLGRKMYLQKMY